MLHTYFKPLVNIVRMKEESLLAASSGGSGGGGAVVEPNASSSILAITKRSTDLSMNSPENDLTDNM